MIERSVGRNSINLKPDVRLVQRLLNDYRDSKGYPLLVVDGLAGANTVSAILDYQKSNGLQFVDGRVDANGPTLQHLLGSSCERLVSGFKDANRMPGVQFRPDGKLDIPVEAVKKYISGLRA